jgi:hypothetical protein
MVVLLLLRIEAGLAVSVGLRGRMCSGGGIVLSAPAVRGRGVYWYSAVLVFVGMVRGGAGK